MNASYVRTRYIGNELDLTLTIVACQFIYQCDKVPTTYVGVPFLSETDTAASSKSKTKDKYSRTSFGHIEST